MENNEKLSGLVYSNAMNKTVVVNIVRSFPHPVYKNLLNFLKNIMFMMKIINVKKEILS